MTLCTKCHEAIKPIVAIDLDGTLGRYHDQFVHFLELYFGRSFDRSWDGSGDWEDYLGLSRRDYQDAKLAFRQGGFKRWMPAFHGATEVVERIRAASAEIWITTTRPYLRLDSVDPDTREWLDRNGIYYDHLLYHDDKYRKLLELTGAGRVVAIVEDLPEQYSRAVTIYGPNVPILMVRGHNTSFRNRPTLGGNGHKFAHNLGEAENWATQAIAQWFKEKALA